ncbi:MAG: ABC transporter substrate-binding protein [Bacteroidales bacterium]|nr:ABC transporter substrate-binding protein [Bacteroidales bacterium]
MKRFVLILLALLPALLLPARPREVSDTLVFTPQWTAQAQFAGYYVAKDMGFYEEEGVNVQIIHPNVTQSAESRLRSHLSHATTLQLAQAVEIVANGVPLVNLLQTSMNSGMVVISRRGKNPMEQRGAKVGIWAGGFTQLLESVVKEANLPFEWIRAATMVNLYIAGALDAIVAMTYNEYYQVKQAGFNLPENCIYRLADHGYNIQEDGLYVTREYYEKHKELADKFARASRRGWDYAEAHPDQALDIVMRYVDRNHIATNRILQSLMLKEILNLQYDPDSGEKEYRIRPDMLQLTNDIMLKAGLIPRPVTLEELCR